ncbi:hypothetical protein [Methylibium sp.]|uniref:hypothetical protein n=1 Tax=Methylibium sp. TaxID=2067992 RepID=UPI003D0BB30A
MNVCCTLFRPTLPVVCALAAAFTPALCSAQSASESTPGGLGLRSSNTAWPRWQGRLDLTSGSNAALAGGRYDPGLDLSNPYSGTLRQSLSLFGDYYFLQHGAAGRDYSGGLRATGGLIYGPRGAAWSALPASVSTLGSGFSAQRRNFSLATPGLVADDGGNGSVPYVGVGYTGLKSLRATGGGWGFSADVGVVALQPRSVVRFGQQGLIDSLRDLQLSPLLQLGVSYSF